MAVNLKKFDAIMALPAPERYDHFIKRAADTEEVWSLWQDGWACVADDDGNEGMPVWPDPYYAEAWKWRSFPDWEVKPINLYWLMDEMLPNVRAEKDFIVVFPNFDGSIWPELDRLEADIRNELGRYE